MVLSTTKRWEPFEVNRLFDNFFVGRPATPTGRAWTPPVAMYATKDDLLTIKIRLPKAEELKPKQIKIDIL
jgi:HSP20 family molecular chaperone IbpA